MTKTRDLVIVGDSAFAEVANEYFTADSPYRVTAFSVERDYLRRERRFDLPVVPLEELAGHFPPADHDVAVAVTYTQLNRLRARLCGRVRDMGYRLAGYRSSRAVVWPSATIGAHCFVFENNVVQPFARIGDNVVLWSGNHVGHHAVIEDNCFVSSHVVISGYARIGANSFLGVNSAVSNNKTVARDCWIGPGVVVGHDTQEGEIYNLEKATPSRVSSLRFFKVPA
jgi:sugar O-acyltransferase (sialic acid O-acetyltransferase NeuD family)